MSRHVEEDAGNVFGIVTAERTYYLTSETPQDKREWCDIIRRVKSMPEAKVKSILAQEVDSSKALMTVDLELIDSVAAHQGDKRLGGMVRGGARGGVEREEVGLHCSWNDCFDVFFAGPMPSLCTQPTGFTS